MVLLGPLIISRAAHADNIRLGLDVGQGLFIESREAGYAFRSDPARAGGASRSALGCGA